jgi:hypothetical protein
MDVPAVQQANAVGEASGVNTLWASTSSPGISGASTSTSSITTIQPIAVVLKHTCNSVLTSEQQVVEAGGGDMVVRQRQRHVEGTVLDRFCAGQRVVIKDTGRFKVTLKQTEVCQDS